MLYVNTFCTYKTFFTKKERLYKRSDTTIFTLAFSFVLYLGFHLRHPAQHQLFIQINLPAHRTSGKIFINFIAHILKNGFLLSQRYPALSAD